MVPTPTWPTYDSIVAVAVIDLDGAIATTDCTAMIGVGTTETVVFAIIVVDCLFSCCYSFGSRVGNVMGIPLSLLFQQIVALVLCF